MAIIAPVEDGKLNYNYTNNANKNGLNPTGSKLGYDQFLQLLCAEMQYQDPMEPTSNTDYVAQMATFSQLEATLSLSESQEQSNASSLVGKQVILKVTSETTGETSYIDGRVDYVMYENGEVFLSVNDGLYPLSSLDTVADGEYYEGITMATAFKDMIGALPLEENLTVAYEKALKQLREIYDGMTSYQKQFVPDEALATLKKYEEKMAELLKQQEGQNPPDGVEPPETEEPPTTDEPPKTEA